MSNGLENFLRSRSLCQGQRSRTLKELLMHALVAYQVSMSVCKTLALIGAEKSTKLSKVKVTVPS